MPDDIELPWDAQTDILVSDLDNVISKKYSNVSLRKLLINPDRYKDTQDIADMVGKIKEDASKYFADMLAGLDKEEADLVKDLENLDAIHTQVNQTISSRTGIGRIPFIKPVDVNLGGTKPETIYIDRYDTQLDALLTKLITASNYVCDLSTTYRKYAIGIWLFSGSRSYMISVSAPESRVMTVENARDLVDSLLEDAGFRLAEA